MHAVLRRAKFVPPSLVNAALPPTVDAWMTRPLAIDPAARFPSMIGCIEALTLALSPPTPPQRRGKRAPDLVMGAATLALCAAALVAAAQATSSTDAAPKPLTVSTGAAAAPAGTACPTQPLAREDDARVEQVVFPPARPAREARVSHTTARAVSYRPDPY
jgi:hypothetical protein